MQGGRFGVPMWRIRQYLRIQRREKGEIDMSVHRLIRLAAILPTLVVATIFPALSIAEEEPSTKNAEANAKECVEVGDLKRWQVFDDHYMFIEGSKPNSTLLLTMRSRCRGVLNVRCFEILNSAGRLCKKKPRIAYKDTGLRRTCRIGTFEYVPNAEEAERRFKERKAQ